MDHDDDVERLFSWIKTPELRYREFAGEREVADAVATWPALRKTAGETGLSGDHLEDHQDGGLEPSPPEPPPAPPASGRSPLGERLASIFGHRGAAPPQSEPAFHERDPDPPPVEPSGEVPWAPAAPVPPTPPPPPIFAHITPAAPPPEPPPPQPLRSAPPAEREPPFGRTYRGFEEHEEIDTPPEPPPHDDPASDDDGARSLDAVFSRLARPARGYRDDRQRATGGSGLGPVFRRLR